LSQISSTAVVRYRQGGGVFHRVEGQRLRSISSMAATMARFKYENRQFAKEQTGYRKKRGAPAATGPGRRLV
jgi:hypothetical protein